MALFSRYQTFCHKISERISHQTDDHRTGQGKLKGFPEGLKINRVQNFSVIFQGQVPLHGGSASRLGEAKSHHINKRSCHKHQRKKYRGRIIHTEVVFFLLLFLSSSGLPAFPDSIPVYKNRILRRKAHADCLPLLHSRIYAIAACHKLCPVCKLQNNPKKSSCKGFSVTTAERPQEHSSSILMFSLRTARVTFSPGRIVSL